ncbi:FecCD family ABC transporter permease [Algihabitans sp.]|uniref:FecCD family ABC transporter permease n=1 Tax=Algihabitans sp. TaxID=2821514 RepID=UPI003BABD035
MTALRTGTGLVVLTALVLAFAWHVAVGARTIPLGTVVQAFAAYDASVFDHVVIRDLRLPRALMAAAVGAGLAVAGALMQGVTRNPLADPGILGLMAGASFAVVLGTFTGLTSPAAIPALAALGALAAAAVVWTISSAVPGGATPMTMVLAGAALTAFLGALTGTMLLIDQTSFENLRVWLTGTLAGRPGDVGIWAGCWLAAGLLIALLAARQVTALAMGDETATGLGVDVGKLRLSILVSVVALTASAVALAGPMGFVGLVVPHMVRLVVGHDYRVIVPGAALAGATYMLLADIAARMILSPIEISTGLITALLGGPIFIWLVRVRL